MTVVKRSFRLTVLGCISKLQDPNLVSAFQNFFGIYPLKNTNSKKGDKPNECENGMPMRKPTKRDIYFFKDTVSCIESEYSGFKIHNWFWYYAFSFGTSLGYEVFYASFFSFWVWNLNFAVCRRVINVWVYVMYIGQMLKDIICWPRPSSPPVVQLEPYYALEYGMPSTHAMVGVTLPFSYWYFSSQRYEYSFYLAAAICSIWCLLVCSSRLYMGMHTVLDIIAGFVLAPFLMGTILPFSDVVDKFQQTCMFSPLLTTIVMLFFLWLYPCPDRWSPAHGDTSIIMGTGTGFAFGSFLNHHLGYNNIEKPFSHVTLSAPSISLLTLWISRMTIGLLCIMVFRTILKKTTYIFFRCVLKKNFRNLNSCRNLYVEITSKYVTYIGIGLVITFIAPRIFYYLGIVRESMYYDV